MGIQGLLPALKPIQKQRHLSELSGQTIAVDGYVWLHRGAYACATDIVLGKPTIKYVDFAMNRVRLMKHHKIKPFIVFDGGPLPAKLGTEKEREKKRAANLAKANALTALGKHSEAREFYTKCLDVTPQMAFQVIKALKAEGVPYIVAPYEADAQLAYLERVGLVDGILTEDSDLLVFGCRNVHFKLDIVSATVVSISRKDFGSSAQSKDSLSLLGWSDAEFRWMAMLSGCDYLPSIPGIGLKTAWSLLRKCGTVDKALKAVAMEGKKSVPRDYLEDFLLAEKVFLHQRVYDPSTAQLVHLADLPTGDSLDERTEAYMGKSLSSSVAKGIAEGNICPISLTPMVDICPRYNGVGRMSKASPLKPRDQNTPSTNKGKQKEPEKGKGKDIRSFFAGSAPMSVTNKTNMKSKAKSKQPISAGRFSGKRTLIDVMESEEVEKRKREASQRRKSMPDSRYFMQTQDLTEDPRKPGTSRRQSLVVDLTQDNLFTTQDEVIIIDEAPIFDPVKQEDGYLSPSPTVSRVLTPDFSSPERPERAPEQCNEDAERIYSPLLFRSQGTKRKRQLNEGHILVPSSSPLVLKRPNVASMDEDILPGPDLRLNFDDEGDLESDNGYWGVTQTLTDPQLSYRQSLNAQDSLNSTPASSGPSTPPDPPGGQDIIDITGDDVIVDDDVVDGDENDDEGVWELDEDVCQRMRIASVQKVAQGWRRKYSLGKAKGLISSQPMPSLQQKITSSQRMRKHDTAPLSQRAQKGLRARRSDPYPMASRKPSVNVGVDRNVQVQAVLDTPRTGRLDMFKYTPR